MLASDRAGDEEQGRRWLDLLTALSSTVGDVVFIAIAQVLREGPSERALHVDGAESSPLANGWRRIVDSFIVG